MLSENAIENLAEPIVKRQQKIDEFIIEAICSKIKAIGSLNSSDIYKLTRMLQMGADVELINEEIAYQTGLQIRDIKKIIRTVAIDGYADARPFYDYRMRSYVPFERNINLQRQVEAIANQTADTYKNLSKSTGFMIRDFSNPTVLKPTPLSEAYQSIIDESVQAVQSGIIDYNTAMRRTLKQLGDSGVRFISYSTESGRTYTQRADTAVRRNILDGVRAINQEVQNIVGREFGADGVEISVHMNPAKDHEAMQGHQYTNAEFDKMQTAQDFKDVQGRKYTGFERAIGTLNCRHFAYSIVIGASKQNFSDEELQAIIDKNEEGYTLPNGKHLTMYECTQYQRQLETKIRQAKDGQIAARAAGNDELVQYYQANVSKYTKQYRAFSNACGLSVRNDKMAVSGYHRVAVKK